MYSVGPRLRMFGEFLGRTSASGGRPELPVTTITSVPAEAAAEALLGTIGTGVHLTPKLFVSLGVSYDNNHELLFRAGITFSSR